jgi:hypothetical protein
VTRPAPVHTSSTSGPLATGASPTAAAALVRLQRLAHLLDSKFRLPVLGIRFGLDPILGLIPGLGDALGLAVSGYIVLEAARMGAPAPLLARMIANGALDALTGSVPVAGSLVDFVLRANRRNVDLLGRWLEAPHAVERHSRRFFWIAGITLLAGTLAALGLGIWLVLWILRRLAGG